MDADDGWRRGGKKDSDDRSLSIPTRSSFQQSADAQTNSPGASTLTKSQKLLSLCIRDA